jgi:hypothetical protein
MHSSPRQMLKQPPKREDISGQAPGLRPVLRQGLTSAQWLPIPNWLKRLCVFANLRAANERFTFSCLRHMSTSFNYFNPDNILPNPEQKSTPKTYFLLFTYPAMEGPIGGRTQSTNLPGSTRKDRIRSPLANPFDCCATKDSNPYGLRTH